MTIRQIRIVPDPVLRTPCDPIREITPAVRSLVEDLLETVNDPGRAGPVSYTHLTLPTKA